MPEDRTDFVDVSAAVFAILGIVTTVFGLGLNLWWMKTAQMVEAAGITTMFFDIVDPVLIGIAAVFFGVLYLIVAYALVERYDLGRYIACILSILFLFAFPIGTVLGLFNFYALLKAPSSREFRNIDWSEELS